MAKTSLKVKQARKPKLFDTCLYQMQTLRKTTFRIKKIRYLPYLF